MFLYPCVECSMTHIEMCEKKYEAGNCAIVFSMKQLSNDFLEPKITQCKAIIHDFEVKIQLTAKFTSFEGSVHTDTNPSLIPHSYIPNTLLPAGLVCLS